MLLTSNTLPPFVNAKVDFKHFTEGRHPMPSFCGDPTIHDLLSDPLTQAVMQADHVDLPALRQMLGTVALEIQSAARQSHDGGTQSQGAPAGGLGVGRWFRSQVCGAC
jgi:hypothetical protein